MRTPLKSLILLALPMLVIAAGGVLGHIDRQPASDAPRLVAPSSIEEDGVVPASPVYTALLALADEQLAAVGIGNGSIDELGTATDQALGDLQVQADFDPDTSESVASAAALVDLARQAARDGEPNAADDYAAADHQLRTLLDDGGAVDDVDGDGGTSADRRDGLWIPTLLILGGLAGLIAALRHVLDSTRRETARDVARHVEESVTERVTDEITRSVTEQVTAEVTEQVTTEVTQRVTTSVSAEVTDRVTRSVSEPFDRLVERVAPIAHDEVPALLQRVGSGGAIDDLVEAEPLPADEDGAVGALSAAFNKIRAAAYEVATSRPGDGRQADHLFADLGRRNHELARRVLARLYDLQRHEEDTEQLQRLFEVDGLVTQVRRHAENLVWLADDSSPRTWDQPVPMADALRAAIGEVACYERVDIGELDDAMLDGDAVADVGHMVAELIDLAADRTDPPGLITVEGIHRGATYTVVVTDGGCVVEPDRLIEINGRLADPAAPADTSIGELGLHLIGRLAARHDAKVELSGRVQRGTMTTVALPAVLVGGEPTEGGETHEDATEESADGALDENGLPIRTRGRSLAVSRRSPISLPPLNRRATDSSGKAADSFSSMMSSLSAGLNRAERRGITADRAAMRRRSTDRIDPDGDRTDDTGDDMESTVSDADPSGLQAHDNGEVDR